MFIPKKNLKILLINTSILLNFLLLIFITPQLYRLSLNVFLKGISISKKILNIKDLNERDKQIRNKYKNRIDLVEPLIEFGNLGFEYNDYIVWRRPAYQGEYININQNGIRKTIQTNAIKNRKKYLMLGGSTIFGFGVADKHTIPSFLSKYTNSEVINLGETGYIARQSLSFLNNLRIEGKINKDDQYTIISYDGANEVSHRCASEINGLETRFQSGLREKNKSSEDPLSLKYFFKPWKTLLNQLNNNLVSKLTNEFIYDCHKNSKKAEYIANTLISNWRLMYENALKNGDNFVAILQPVTYSANSYDLSKNDIFGKQFKVVYPIILEKVKKEDFKFIDLTQIFENDMKNTFFDFCHLDKQGNKFVARKIFENLKIE